MLITITTYLGLLKFHVDKNPLSMWLPPESNFVRDTNWIVEQYGEGTREEIIIIESKNVLDLEILQKLEYINKRVTQIHADLSSGEVFSYDDICFKLVFKKV